MVLKGKRTLRSSFINFIEWVSRFQIQKFPRLCSAGAESFAPTAIVLAPALDETGLKWGKFGRLQPDRSLLNILNEIIITNDDSLIFYSISVHRIQLISMYIVTF